MAGVSVFKTSVEATAKCMHLIKLRALPPPLPEERKKSLPATDEREREASSKKKSHSALALTQAIHPPRQSRGARSNFLFITVQQWNGSVHTFNVRSPPRTQRTSRKKNISGGSP